MVGTSNFFTYVFPVLALILSFPIAVLATILTPKISNWFSMRNLKKITSRINFLNHQLELLNSFFEKPILASAMRSKMRMKLWRSSLIFFLSILLLVSCAYLNEKIYAARILSFLIPYCLASLVFSGLFTLGSEIQMIVDFRNLQELNSDILSYPASQKMKSTMIDQLIRQKHKLEQSLKKRN